MKAIVFDEFGGPEVLRYADISDPSPGRGEVLIEVHSVSVNITLDIVVRSGRYARGTTLPHVLGVDPAGVVAALGPGVENVTVGDRVAVHVSIPCGACEACGSGREGDCMSTSFVGVDRWGGYAAYVVVPAEVAFAIPDGLAFAEATVVMRHVPTARHMLASAAALKSGESILVMGAAGGLGTSLIQVAKLMGARVIAAAGSDERLAGVIDDYGADHGINYRTQDLETEVMSLTDGRGVEVVAENIADPDLWTGAQNSLAVGGRLVTAGAHGGGVVPFDVRRFYPRRQRIIASPHTHFDSIRWAFDATSRHEIRAARIDRIMPLRDAADAHRLSEQRAVHGKIVLDPKA